MKKTFPLKLIIITLLSVALIGGFSWNYYKQNVCTNLCQSGFQTEITCDDKREDLIRPGFGGVSEDMVYWDEEKSQWCTSFEFHQTCGPKPLLCR